MSADLDTLLVELFVEELPPKALKKLGQAFAAGIAEGLKSRGLAPADSAVTAFASPRRLAVQVSGVRQQAPDGEVRTRLMSVSAGLTSSGEPTPALRKKLAVRKIADVDLDKYVRAYIRRESDGKTEQLIEVRRSTGTTLLVGLEAALEDALEALPIPKLMSYQLDGGTVAQQLAGVRPGWTSVQFVRPAHGLVALHGSRVVPVMALGLQAGRVTRGHRFEARIDPLPLRDAHSYAEQLRDDGAVIASFDERRAEIARQLAVTAAAAGQGLTPIDDDALLDEVTALVERPNVLLCRFEPEFLAVPQECLILTMKANQKYFPLLDASGRLTHQFLVVSNISPDDASRVVQGNERVVRPRLADAKFFFDQDRKRSLADRVAGLARVVYHHRLGNQHERMVRVRQLAGTIGAKLGGAAEGPALAASAERAALLAKADLLTDMVGEFPELQGVMGGYYARHDGETEGVALAVEDHYKPRFAGDALPRNRAGLAVALADKLETLAGMFGIGQLPTGDKDPFALRRHALGVVRMLVECDLPLFLTDIVDDAYAVFPAGHGQNQTDCNQFLRDRLAVWLHDKGHTTLEIEAVLAIRPRRWGELPRRLAAVRDFATLAEAAPLAAANKRVWNLLKKSEEAGFASVDPFDVNPNLLVEPAEQQLHSALGRILPSADAAFAAGDYTGSLRALAALKAPVDAFFDQVMVNAEDPALRANRLALLAELHASMNRVADLSRLAG